MKRPTNFFYQNKKNLLIASLGLGAIFAVKEAAKSFPYVELECNLEQISTKDIQNYVDLLKQDKTEMLDTTLMKHYLKDAPKPSLRKTDNFSNLDL